MKIIITSHFIKQFKDRTKAKGKLKEIKKEIEKLFINMYQYGNITMGYNLREEIYLNEIKIVFKEENEEYTLITYINYDKKRREEYKKELRKEHERNRKKHKSKFVK